MHDDVPAYLYHGGKQVLAARLRESLKDLGVDVDYAQWWNTDQRVDIIHTLGCSPWLVSSAHEVGVKIVLTHIVDEMSNSSGMHQIVHRARNAAFKRLAPEMARRHFLWSVLPDIDELVYINGADARTAIHVYGIPRPRVSVIPHGCTSAEMERLQSGSRVQASYLVSLGSIVPRKNAVLLALAAGNARVPVVFLGKPFNEEDSYFREFKALVDGVHVRWAGHVTDDEKVEWLTGASGFVLMSRAESGCVAAYEAAAAGLPMLLADRPWAREFAESPLVHLVAPREEVLASELRSFFLSSQRMEGCTFPVPTWRDVARRYVSVYERALDQVAGERR